MKLYTVWLCNDYEDDCRNEFKTNIVAENEVIAKEKALKLGTYNTVVEIEQLIEIEGYQILLKKVN